MLEDDEIMVSDKGGEATDRNAGATEHDLPRELWDRLSMKERKKAMRFRKAASTDGDHHVTGTPVVNEAEAEPHEPGNQ